MAKLGKGILGSPVGVIGSLNCYNRLGKSIIQSRSYPVDAYHRRWNLLQWQLRQRLLYYWQFLSVSQVNHWSTRATGGRSGQEQFIFEALEFVYTNRFDTLNGVLFGYQNAFSFVDARLFGAFNATNYSLKFNLSQSFWSGSTSGRLSLQVYNSDSTVDLYSATIPVDQGNELEVSIPVIYNPLALFYTIYFRQFPSSGRTWSLLVDLYNPSIVFNP